MVKKSRKFLGFVIECSKLGAPLLNGRYMKGVQVPLLSKIVYKGLCRIRSLGGASPCKTLLTTPLFNILSQSCHQRNLNTGKTNYANDPRFNIIATNVPPFAE